MTTTPNPPFEGPREAVSLFREDVLRDAIFADHAAFASSLTTELALVAAALRARYLTATQVEAVFTVACARRGSES